MVIAFVCLIIRRSGFRRTFPSLKSWSTYDGSTAPAGAFKRRRHAAAENADGQKPGCRRTDMRHSRRQQIRKSPKHNVSNRRKWEGGFLEPCIVVGGGHIQDIVFYGDFPGRPLHGYLSGVFSGKPGSARGLLCGVHGPARKPSFALHREIRGPRCSLVWRSVDRL